MTFEVRQLAEDDWALYRDVRLEALADAPEAFGSTYVHEVAFTEGDWRARFQTGAVVVAFDNEVAVGLIGGGTFTRPSARDLVSMWVDDSLRGSGVGDALVHILIDWARKDGAEEVLLFCVDDNKRAMRFYRRVGFTPTGNTKQYANDPSKNETELRFVL